MNKFHPYFGQVVTETDLAEILNELTGGIERFIQDFGYFGIAAGAAVTSHTPLNLTVDVTPGIAYDQQARRMQWLTARVVDLTVDEYGSPTASQTHQKWISIFAAFTSTPTDPRTNELNQTVYYRDVAGVELRVVQGPESAAPSPAPLRGDQVLLADVLLHGQAGITHEDISFARTQTIYRLGGAHVSVGAKSLQEAMQSMLDAINAAYTAINDVSGASSAAIAAAVAALNASLSTLAQRVDGLSASDLSTAAIAGSPKAIGATTIFGAISQLVSFVNEIWGRPVVLLNAENTFSAAKNNFNRITTHANVDDEALFTQVAVGSGNKWAHLWEIRLDGSHKIHFYVGDPSNAADIGYFVVCWNAYWNISTQRWNRHDASDPAIALVLYRGEPRLCRSTSAEWERWPEATIYGADFAFPADVNRSSAVMFDRTWVGVKMLVTSLADPIPLKLPEGAKLSSIDVKVFQNGATACRASVGAYVADWNSDNANDVITVGSQVIGPGGSGTHTFRVECGDHAINNTNAYYITVLGGQANDYLWAMRANWKDTGPSY